MKFGENGYAKFFFKDEEYENFLKEIRELLSDKNLFINTQRTYINELKNKGDIWFEIVDFKATFNLQWTSI